MKFNEPTQLSFKVNEFITACECGDLTYIKKQTTDKNFIYYIIEFLMLLLPEKITRKIKKQEELNLHKIYDLAISRASSYGQLDIIKFLIEKEYFKQYQKKDIFQIMFKKACEFEKIEVIDYLIVNKENNIEIEDGIIVAIENEAIKTLEFLIFDKKINKTNKLINYLKDQPNKELESMFYLRELNKELSKKQQKIENKNKI